MGEAREEIGRSELPLPEGAERPPAGTRTAAIVRWGLVALMALIAAGAWIREATHGGIVGGAEARYHCPMHPSIVQQRRGECPVCGMDLVRIDGDDDDKPTAAGKRAAAPPTQAPGPAAAAYQCPTHPSLGTQPQPGKCAVCGKDLVAVTAGRATKPASGGGAAEYTCPMHPAFVTGDPKARCPDCGMKLVPRGADAAAAEGVRGLVPVELSAERIQLIGMKTAVATREPLPASIRTPAFVTPTERGFVSVTARYTGWIESVAVDETGRLVEKGDVLAMVYSPELTAALQSAAAATRWSSSNPVAPAGVPNAAADARREAGRRAELLGLAREDVERIVQSGEVPQTVPIRSPVRGHVARKGALRGLYVSPGTELFQIADLGTVWAVADVQQGEIGRVRVGQRAEVELPAWPGERFSGKVTFVSPALAAASRTLQARIELRNPGLRLRPGMFGDATLDLGAVTAVTVPADAVVDTGEDQYVFVSRGNGRFEPRRIRAGWRGGGRVAVLDGIAEGERVVTTANFLLDSESRLRAAIEGFGSR
jgi:multidrug efflux pump subunit AcrA (membrane-fusion protein)